MTRSVSAAGTSTTEAVVVLCVAASLLTLTAVGKHRSELASGLDLYAGPRLVGGKQSAAVLVSVQ